jgi:hypothetical protein
VGRESRDDETYLCLKKRIDVAKDFFEMPNSIKKKLDPELKRLEKALLENEKLMRQAAINYEDLVAAKEDIAAAIKARKVAQAKNGDR